MKKLLTILFLFICLKSFGQIAGTNTILKSGSTVLSFNNSVFSTEIPYNGLALAHIARMDSTPPDFLKLALSMFFDTIQACGIDDKWDTYNLYAMHTQQAANLDLARPNDTVIPTGTIAFTPYNGYKGNASNFYINHNYDIAADGVNYTLDDATIHVYNYDNDFTVGKGLTGTYDGTPSPNSSLIVTANNIYTFRLNNFVTSSFVYHRNSIVGSVTATRDQTDTVRMLMNDGYYISRGASTSASLPDYNVFSDGVSLNGVLNSPTNTGITAVYYGGALTESQAQCLHRAENRYINAVNGGLTIDTTVIYARTDGSGDFMTIDSCLQYIIAQADYTYTNQYVIDILGIFYEQNLQWLNFVGLQGEDTATSKIIGYLPPDTTASVIQNMSTIDCHQVIWWASDVHISAKNMRYPIHSDYGGASDNTSMLVRQDFENVKLENWGTLEADTIQSDTILEVSDAFGSGLSSNVYFYFDSCYLISHGYDLEDSRGLGVHSKSIATNPGKVEIKNSICETKFGNNAIRVGMNYNPGNQDLYIFENVTMIGGSLYIDGSGGYTDNTTIIGADPYTINGTILAD